ncbi:MAG: DUF3795 domain-containing protein [Eubacteriales bacterium]|nr:DUF3795 domain-containing protein [Eubacteriales bacterium]
MDRSKGMAYCGLACCVCSENAACAGCRNEGCKDRQGCKPFNCCKEKGISGCWECADFPCDTPMLQKLRCRTFAKVMGEMGAGKLMDALEAREKEGVVYHYPGQLVGDYDKAQDEESLRDMLGLDGKPSSKER